MKRLRYLLTAALLAFVSLTSIPGLVPTASAAADTCTWTGGGGDNNFSTAANWTGCDNGGVPENGDSLVFNLSTSPNDEFNRPTELHNDLGNGIQFNSIAFTGNGSATANGYRIVGDTIEILSSLDSVNIDTDLIINNQVAVTSRGCGPDGAVCKMTVLTGDISGSGGLTADLVNSSDDHYVALFLYGGTNSFAGDLIINSGLLEVSGAPQAFGSTAGKTYINDGASFSFLAGIGNTFQIQEDFVFAGSAHPNQYIRDSKISISVGFGPLSGPVKSGGITFSGTVDVEDDTVIWSYGHNVRFNNVTDNGHAFTRAPGAFGDMVVEGVSIDSPYYTATLSDSQPASSLSVSNREMIAVNGSRSDVSVAYDGFLKGSGTVGAVSVAEGGTLSPGMSPGCLTSGDVEVAGGAVEIEIGGTTACTEYDQQIVNGTVTLDSTALNVVRWDDFYPSAGNKFVIISNDGTDAITGTFENMPEGATFTQDGVTYRISYVGGDGNDVELTVVEVPGAPDTGVPSVPSAAWMAGVGIAALAVMAGLQNNRKAHRR